MSYISFCLRFSRLNLSVTSCFCIMCLDATNSPFNIKPSGTRCWITWTRLVKSVLDDDVINVVNKEINQRIYNIYKQCEVIVSPKQSYYMTDDALRPQIASLSFLLFIFPSLESQICHPLARKTSCNIIQLIK